MVTAANTRGSDWGRWCRSERPAVSIQRAACLLACLLWLCLDGGSTAATEGPLKVGFAEADITPKLGGEVTVWLAGYAPGRAATKLHDPIMARCVVLEADDQRLAIVSVDLIGMQLPDIQRVRQKLPGFGTVLVSSTHNHEGPDVIGLWGASMASRGVDDTYVTLVVDKLVEMVREAARRLTVVRPSFGAATDPSLLRDSRLPTVKDATLRLLQFHSPQGKLVGSVVQWNCHPEAMGSKNQEITADFTGVTVETLQDKWKSPVVFVSGAVGGLMAPPREFPGFSAAEIDRDRWGYMAAYGRAVAKLAEKASQETSAIAMTPFRAVLKPIAVPIDNAYYRSALTLGVLQRASVVWTGDPWDTTEAPTLLNQLRRRALVTEVGWVRCGEMYLACVPGEIYPELVTGEYQDPVEPNVDFPKAARELSIREMMGNRTWMLFGLCNDEIGYLIPKSQWDQKPPYAYGRTKSQYGEINACTVEAAPIIMRGLSETLKELGP